MKKDLEMLLQLEELLLTKQKYELMCLEMDLGEIRQKISKLRRQMPSELLSRYDKLSQIWPDVVTIVESEICQGCQQKVSHRLAMQAKKSCVCCEHCGRFLISTEDAPNYIH